MQHMLRDSDDEIHIMSFMARELSYNKLQLRDSDDEIHIMSFMARNCRQHNCTLRDSDDEIHIMSYIACKLQLWCNKPKLSDSDDEQYIILNMKTIALQKIDPCGNLQRWGLLISDVPIYGTSIIMRNDIIKPKPYLYTNSIHTFGVTPQRLDHDRVHHNILICKHCQIKSKSTRHIVKEYLRKLEQLKKYYLNITYQIIDNVYFKQLCYYRMCMEINMLKYHTICAINNDNKTFMCDHESWKIYYRYLIFCDEWRMPIDKDTNIITAYYNIAHEYIKQLKLFVALPDIFWKFPNYSVKL